MLDRPTWLTDAEAVTRWPTYTGARNESSSIRAVTTRERAWRVAAAPAQASMSFMISPPCTFPYGFASEGSMVRDMIVFEAATGFGAMKAFACVMRSNPRLTRMSVLSREDLRAALASSPPLVEGLDLQVQPNGIDLRVDRVQRLTSPGLLGEADNVREPAAREDVQADKDGWWDLHRGAYVITYQEKVNLPTDIMALARPRSTLLRSGVAIHAAVWDAGYSGRGEGLLSVLNARGYRLQRGARVLQLVFFRLASPTAEGYKGRYHGENAG
jgi:dUTP diphosphatase